MSQAGVLNAVSNSPLPPTIPTSFATDLTSPAIPSGNVLQIKGSTSTDNNANGIETKANPSLSNLLNVQLTNRAVGSTTTNDGSTVTVVTLPLGVTPGTYVISGVIAAYATNVAEGGGYFYEGVVRTNGIVATELGGQFTTYKEDNLLVPAFVTVTTTGNDCIIEVTGVIGLDIDWTGILTYQFAS